MLEIGNGLTIQQSRSHFAFWAIMKSPLFIGTNMIKILQADTDILQNKYLLTFNQDPVYGKPAQPCKWYVQNVVQVHHPGSSCNLGDRGINPDWTFNATNPAEFWSGSYTDDTLVALLNTLTNTRTMTAKFDEIPQLSHGGPHKVTDA